MIKIVNISKVYGDGKQAVHALKDVSLEVPQGSIMGVIGSSGAGKSTLIRCVNLLERPSSGSVLVDGQDLTRLSEAQLRQARHQIGMIFQHFNLLSSRTVYDNIALPLELMGHDKRAIQAAVEPLLELTGLVDKRNQYPTQLSGGQKQRVAIARALASRPKVLLCDEATSALDPQTTRSILELLQDINRKLGLTILLITHEMEVVKAICDRVAILSHGELIEENNVSDFFSQPRTALAKEFVRAALNLELPPELARQLQPSAGPGTHPVIQLSFVGDSVSRPLISQVVKTFGVDISILQSNIEFVRDKTMGLLVAELMGPPQATRQAIEYMTQQDLQLEVIGHVARADQSAA